LSAGAPGAPRAVTGVAVGVLLRPDGAVLMAERPAGKPYAGFWEFPGGKIEPGETVEQALERELGEELGVRIGASYPWVVMEYDYPHAYVRLHFRRVFEWRGTAHPAEGQRLLYLQPGATPPAPLLPAAVPALRWIELPTMTLASPGCWTQPAQAAAWLDAAIERGARQLTWHEPALEGAALRKALQHACAAARAYGARVLVDSRDLARAAVPALAADAGCLLGSAALRAAGARPAHAWVGAGVRDRNDLERAAALACDFAIIEPGAPDGGAGDARWDRIGALCRAAPLPVYAPVAPGAQALQQAWRCGAHGLALARLD